MSENTNPTIDSMVPAEQQGKLLWYVIHTYSGYENKVLSTLQKAVDKSEAMSKLIHEICIPMEEVERMLHPASTEIKTDIAIGQDVRVLSGSLENVIATVEDIDPMLGTVKVKVMMFAGREQLVDLPIDQVQKVEN